MDNQGKKAGNWKICIGIESQLILPEEKASNIWIQEELAGFEFQFLACNHMTRQPCWWCVGGQYSRIFSQRIYMKIGFSS